MATDGLVPALLEPETARQGGPTKSVITPRASNKCGCKQGLDIAELDLKNLDADNRALGLIVEVIRFG